MTTSHARHTTQGMTAARNELFGRISRQRCHNCARGFAQPEMMIEVQGIAVAD
jgi:hypothetical protein